MTDFFQSLETAMGRDREAALHARWHHALDDPTTEPGPIGDHIRKHDADLIGSLLADAADLVHVEARWLYELEQRAAAPPSWGQICDRLIQLEGILRLRAAQAGGR